MKAKVVLFLLVNILAGSTLTVKRPGPCEQLSCQECLHSPRCYGSYHAPTDSFDCHARNADEQPEFKNGTAFILSNNCCPNNPDFHSAMCGFQTAYNDTNPQLDIDWEHPLVWGTVTGITAVLLLIIISVIFCCVKLCRRRYAGSPPPLSLVELIHPAEVLAGEGQSRRMGNITSTTRDIARRVQGPDHTSNLQQAIRMSWRARRRTLGGADE